MTTKVASTLSMVCLAAIMVVTSCTKDTVDSTVKSYTDAEYSVLSQSLDLPTETANYKSPELPAHLAGGGFVGNSVSNHGATLGRVLFHDSRLSVNNTVNCASCHKQEAAFSDTRAFSLGYEGEESLRNSIALGNVRFYYHDRGFFWDERAQSVEEQVRQTVSNHLEMGMNFDELPNKLKEEEFYTILFRKAYGDSDITSDRIANALAQYVRSVLSFEAPFDKAATQTGGSSWTLINADMVGLSAQENSGRAIYAANCSSCHGNIVTLGKAKANNGLEMVYTDQGVGALTNNQSQMGIFKVPHLRNIGLSAPYMHDGRFATIDAVIEHYSTGVVAHENLDNLLPVGGFNFAAQEKEDLKAFLGTLTDTEFTQKAIYATPFK
ncbi:MAG: cytochrome c peroxidase [Paraglaciecola sp.]|jgi:cytochrome c peroxidase